MNKLIFCLALSLMTHTLYASPKAEMESAYLYFLDEVEKDAILTHEEQHNKIEEFKNLADSLSPEEASSLMTLLIEETRSRILDMLTHAQLDEDEIAGYLAGYDEAVFKVEDMSVEIAREMLFFVAELKIHRQYVYDFGIALGCPAKQLLRHDLCKLDVDQFEGYARYFRGGRREEDKSGYLAAWALHQYAEHHHQSYSKEGFNFDLFSEEDIKNNMLETVADLLAANKQRGGGSMISYLIDIFPKQQPHRRLLPYLEEGLKKAHTYYLESEENSNSEYELFQGLPCWNPDIEAVFNHLKHNFK
jgi:hypothetical protein